MRRIVLLLLIGLLLTGSVCASTLPNTQTSIFGADSLEQEIPKEAKELLGEISPLEQTDFSSAFTDLVFRASEKGGGYLKSAATVMLRVLLIVIACRLVEMGEGEHIGKATALAGALAITACCVSDLRGMIGLGKSTMESIANFSTMLLPVLASASAAAGSAAGAGTLYTITTLFSNVLIRLSTSLLLPLLYGYLGLSLVDCAMQENRMKKLCELLAWLVRFGLKAVMYGFTGFLAITGVLSGTADAAALKAAKVTISGMVPVVGNIISDAAETVLAGAGVLKGAIGTFGMLVVLAVFALPFLQMGIQYLAFKFTAALCGTAGSRMVGLLDAVSDVMGFLLGMTGSSALMSLLSCICFMKAVSL